MERKKRKQTMAILRKALKKYPNKGIKFAVVTTFSEQGYKDYGRGMIKSFHRTWPDDIDLYVYYDVKPTESAKRIKYRNLNKSCPGLIKFKERNKDNKRLEHASHVIELPCFSTGMQKYKLHERPGFLCKFTNVLSLSSQKHLLQKIHNQLYYDKGEKNNKFVS